MIAFDRAGAYFDMDVIGPFTAAGRQTGDFGTNKL